MVRIADRTLIKWYAILGFISSVVLSATSANEPVKLRFKFSQDPAIRFYIIYLANVHNFHLESLDEEHLLLLNPKKETVDLIQECIDELQDRNTYQRTEETDAPTTPAVKKKKSTAT